MVFLLSRKGSPQKGVEKEQETAADGEGRRAERKRSSPVDRGNGENR